jgi:hypothetical protein
MLINRLLSHFLTSINNRTFFQSYAVETQAREGHGPIDPDPNHSPNS